MGQGGATMTQKYAGLIIPSHCVRNTATKKRAEARLSGYQLASHTADEWIEHLENGRTIIPGAFSPKPDGTYTHAEKYWNSTHFILCDADHIKGVEFDDDGNDKFPNGVEPLEKRRTTINQVPRTPSRRVRRRRIRVVHGR